MSKISPKLHLVVVLLVFLSFFLVPKIVFGANSSLSFSPSDAQFEANANKTVDVVLDTSGEQIVGVDLIIDYDPDVFEITAIVGDLQIFSYKTKEIIDNPGGRIKVGLSNDYGKTFSGKASIATIYFRFKNLDRSTDMQFFYEQNNTNDSNVVNSAGIDVLNSAGNFKVKTTSNTNTSETTPDPNVLGVTNRQVNKIEQGGNLSLSPTDSEFVFPNKIESNPSVLGTDILKDLQPETQTGNFIIFLTIVGIVLLVIIVFATAIFIYHENKKIEQSNHTGSIKTDIILE